VGTYNVGLDEPFDKNPGVDDIIEIQSPRIVRLGIQVSF